MGAIKKAFEKIGNALEGFFKGVGQVIKGIVTLDLKGAAQGLNKIAKAGAELASGILSLTPAAIAVNTLMKGALTKLLDKAAQKASEIAQAVINNVMEPLQKIKNGVVGFAKGILKGDFKQALEGIKDIALGALETASNFGPGGVAKNVARLAVDAAVDVAAQKASSAVAQAVDPNGTTLVGGLLVDATAAAVTGGLTAGRAGPRADGRSHIGDDIQLGGRTARDQAVAVMQEGLVDAATQKLTSALALPPMLTALLGNAPLAASDRAARDREERADEESSRATAARASAARRAEGPAQPTREQAVRDAVEGTVSAAVHSAVFMAVDEAIARLSQQQLFAFGALGRLGDMDLAQTLRGELSGTVEQLALRQLDNRGAALKERLAAIGSEGLRATVAGEMRRIGIELTPAVTDAVLKTAERCVEQGLDAMAQLRDSKEALSRQLLEMNAVRV